MESHPKVDLRSHEGYKPEVIETADDDLMTAVLNPPPFPFLEELRSSSRLRTFEEILSSPLDEDQDYFRLTGQGLRSTLYPEALWVTFARQPIGVLANLSVEFEEARWEVLRALDSGGEVVVDAGEATPSGSDTEMVEGPLPEDACHPAEPEDDSAVSP